MAKAKRGRKPKQGFLDGMEPPHFPDIDDAAEIYDQIMRERAALSKQEDEAKQNLIDKMSEHGIDVYTTPDGIIVQVTSKKNVRIKHKLDAESNGEADE